jgi:hypothetical protein
MQPCKIWIEQCEAARVVEDEFGTQQALKYLIEEKFINYLDASETDTEFRAEIPAFVAEIKQLFERWQLSEFLETARGTEPFDLRIYSEQGDDPEDIELERKAELRSSAADLMLVEQARGWLLDE